MWGLTGGMFRAGVRFDKLPEPLSYGPDGSLSWNTFNLIPEWILCPACAKKSQKYVSSHDMGVKPDKNPRTLSFPISCKKCHHLLWEAEPICRYCGYIDWKNTISFGLVGVVLFVAALVILNVNTTIPSDFGYCPGIIGLVFFAVLVSDLNKIWKGRNSKGGGNLNSLVDQLVALYDKSPRGEGFLTDSVESQPVREIGKKLDELGGKELMLKVHTRFAQKRRAAARNLEMVWDGIGDWRG
jgi:hypothetical protein